MKTTIIFFSFLLFLFMWQGCSSGGYQNNDNNNIYQSNPDYPQFDVNDLNQYGYWEDVSPYGRVWVPSVVDDWRPYTNGHWAYDGNNWTWISYEPFGWIVYHYGSWQYDNQIGWFWIPSDNGWSPANVDWMYYGDQVAWAPMRYNNEIWPEPWDVGGGRYWNVVPMQNFTNENVRRYRIDNPMRAADNANIIRRAPDFAIVQRHVDAPIPVVKINRVQESTQVRNDSGQRGQQVNPPTRNGNTAAASNNPRTRKPIYQMQIPPQEKAKVERNRGQVEKKELVKKDQQKEQQKVNNQRSEQKEKDKRSR